MPRYNGDLNLDGILIFPSGADNRMAVRSISTESPTGQPASGQIRFLPVGNEEGYWYLFNNPTKNLFDFSAGSLPSGSRIATLDDVNGETLSRFSMNFYGEDLGSGVTSVELMEENTEIGIPLARILRTARVAVKFRRNVGAAPGDWTLRLFQNGVEVATFAVATT